MPVCLYFCARLSLKQLHGFGCVLRITPLNIECLFYFKRMINKEFISVWRITAKPNLTTVEPQAKASHTIRFALYLKSHLKGRRMKTFFYETQTYRLMVSDYAAHVHPQHRRVTSGLPAFRGPPGILIHPVKHSVRTISHRFLVRRWYYSGRGHLCRSLAFL